LKKTDSVLAQDLADQDIVSLNDADNLIGHDALFMKTSSGLSKLTMINNKLAGMADEELIGVNDRYKAKMKKLTNMKNKHKYDGGEIDFNKELTIADYAIRNAVY